MGNTIIFPANKTKRSIWFLCADGGLGVMDGAGGIMHSSVKEFYLLIHLLGKNMKKKRDNLYMEQSVYWRGGIVWHQADMEGNSIKHAKQSNDNQFRYSNCVKTQYLVPPPHHCRRCCTACPKRNRWFQNQTWWIDRTVSKKKVSHSNFSCTKHFHRPDNKNNTSAYLSVCSMLIKWSIAWVPTSMWYFCKLIKAILVYLYTFKQQHNSRWYKSNLKRHQTKHILEPKGNIRHTNDQDSH